MNDRAAGASRTRTILPAAAGVVLGAGFLVLLWTSIDLGQVSALLARATLAPLFLALLAYAMDFVLRAVRFWYLLEPGETKRIALRPTVAPFIASFGISDILPFRLGDLFRIHWFHTRFGLPGAAVIGAMIVERLLDLAAILVVAGGAVWLARSDLPSSIAHDLAGVLAVAAGASVIVLLAPRATSGICTVLAARTKRAWLQRLADAARSLALALKALGGFGRMAALLAVSVALWLLESLVMVGAWMSLGGTMEDGLKPLVAFGLATLGTLVPALPGHFGSYDAAGVLSFTVLGVPAEAAAAVVLLAHLLLWLPTVLFGIAWLLLTRPAEFRRGTNAIGSGAPA
ncbi:lysylphosphatidylglycerol synthase transmembrane domain-containing protein [Novosphingobium panipatense]|uniref:Flippase-like domain-containing protein n=1 Tax=Novosphingobium panipatense TaxID=428991 RepID=A0ABY1QI12_9SPHN|nr:lysylphosphatidylglycerol synthase transmembrane domain-containing protein [Novosphingobium panipatense]SMP71629.1 conserved hypothetical protein [Novosphingobium panipatense]